MLHFASHLKLEQGAELSAIFCADLPDDLECRLLEHMNNLEQKRGAARSENLEKALTVHWGSPFPLKKYRRSAAE